MSSIFDELNVYYDCAKADFLFDSFAAVAWKFLLISTFQRHKVAKFAIFDKLRSIGTKIKAQINKLKYFLSSTPTIILAE